MPTSGTSERLVRRAGALRVGRQSMMRAFIIAALAITCASLLFRSQMAAVVALPAPHDDGLFLRLAEAVGNGEWLGPYDPLTLAKGPAFPIFIAVVDYLQLPLKLTEHAIYLGAAGFLSYVVYRLTRSVVVSLVLYSALALNPLMWSHGMARIVRDGPYVGLSLWVIAIVAWLFLVHVPVGAGTSRRGWVVAALAGLVLGIYWLTREEGIWLIPALGVLVAASAWRHWTVRPTAATGTAASEWRPVLALVGVRLVLVAAGGIGVLGGLTALNGQVYGVPLTNDLTGGAFPAAYGALTRIEHDDPDRYVPVPAAARADAYRVSPAAAELQPFLEGEMGAQWIYNSCGGPPDPETGCIDIRGGSFLWALRGAITLAGHWDSAPAAQEFLTRLAREVNAACDARRLACGPPRASLTPPIGIGTLVDASAHLLPGLARIVDSRDVQTGTSLGSPADVVRVALRIGPVAPLAPASQIRIRGWVAGIDGLPGVMQLRGGDDPGREEATMHPASDVDAFFEAREEDFISRRFELITDCIDDGCHIVVEAADGSQHLLRTVDLAVGAVLQQASLWVWIEQVQPVRSGSEEVDGLLDTATQTAHPRIIAAMQWLHDVYAILLPVGMIVGMVGVGLAILRRDQRARLAAPLILANACVAAVAARLMLVALIEVTSWPGAMDEFYLLPASPFLVAFAVLGSYLAMSAGTDLVRRRSGRGLQEPDPDAA